MSEEIRKNINKVKNWKQFLNENNTMNNVVYHGGQLNNSNVDDLLYVSFDKNQAQAYADNNDGIVHTFNINTENIISEDKAREILIENNFKSKEMGWDLENELNIYEILDPNFSTSLSNEDLNKYFNILKSKGITGIEFTDMNIISLKNTIQTILVINKSILKKI